MRRKIAKRWRRKILQHAVITVEHWETYKEDNPKWFLMSKKDYRCFVVEIKCNGLTIVAPERDELSAYKAAFDCVEFALETPHSKENSNA